MYLSPVIFLKDRIRVGSAVVAAQPTVRSLRRGRCPHRGIFLSRVILIAAAWGFGLLLFGFVVFMAQRDFASGERSDFSQRRQTSLCESETLASPTARRTSCHPRRPVHHNGPSDADERSKRSRRCIRSVLIFRATRSWALWG